MERMKRVFGGIPLAGTVVGAVSGDAGLGNVFVFPARILFLFLLLLPPLCPSLREDTQQGYWELP